MRFFIALKSLLPHGRFWQFSDSGYFAALLKGMAREFERQSDASKTVAQEAIPITATEETLLLWEELFNINPPIGATIAERRTAVALADNNKGHNSINFITSFVNNLGYVCTVRKESPSRVSELRVGFRVREHIYGTVFLVDLLEKTNGNLTSADITFVRERLIDRVVASANIGVAIS